MAVERQMKESRAIDKKGSDPRIAPPRPLGDGKPPGVQRIAKPRK